MKFSDPLWFLLLIPLTVWFFYRFKIFLKSRISLPYSDLSLVKRWIDTDFREEKIIEVLKILALVFLVVALARPQKILKGKEPPQPIVDILLCLDTSTSMSAVDFDPLNRLEAAKKAAVEFIKKRPMDRVGLVVFGGRAVTQCPLTLDHESLIELLKTVPVDATKTKGTAIGTAMALSATRLAESRAKSKIIVLLTDGRSNVGSIDPLTAASAAGELGIKIYTIGTAVPGGGLVPVEDPIFGKRMVRMAQDLDEGTLREVAIMTQAKYFRVTSSRKFKEIYDQIDALEKTKIEVEVTTSVKDFYLPFLLVAMVLVCSALILENTVWRTVP